MDKDARAKNALTSRNVDVLLANDRGIWATVRGTSTVHKTKLEVRGSEVVPWCDCANPKHECYHVLALHYIWIPKP